MDGCTSSIVLEALYTTDCPEIESIHDGRLNPPSQDLDFTVFSLPSINGADTICEQRAEKVGSYPGHYTNDTVFYTPSLPPPPLMVVLLLLVLL